MSPLRSNVGIPPAGQAFGAAVSGGLRWVGPWLPKMALRWRDLKRALPPLKVRWGWVLLLAVTIVLAMGECGPAACAIASVP